MKMKNFILFLFACLILHSDYLYAQNAGAGSVDRMHRDVALLASDSLLGREAGTIGEQMASDYISGQMKQIGLLPKGDSLGSFLSPFRMSYPVIFKEAKLMVNDIEFKHIEEFGATDLSSQGNITAPLINIGRGINNSDNSNGDIQEKIRGKIVVIDIAYRQRKAENPEVLSHIISNIKSAVLNGAVGIILHNSSRKPTENLLFGSPFTESLNVPVVYIARLPYNKIARIKTATCKLSVEIDRSISKPANVVGWIDNKSSKTVVIGAHYDHVGITRSRTGADKTPQIHNGADDNASGTAALLELARWAVNNESLKYNYIFVAFSAEEKGLFGSKAFCSLPWISPSNIVYMLNMDMVGRLGCQGDTMSVLGVASSPAWDGLLDKTAHPGFSLKRINGAPAFSDHAPFLKKGIPVIYFTTGIHPDYHTPKDDTELINFSGMTELIGYLREFIRSAEALPEIPFHKINPLQHTKAYIQTF
jgi:aminopeptidase YwaD